MGQTVMLFKTMGIGLLLAALVCLDSAVCTYLKIDFFPYMLSFILAVILLTGLILLPRMNGIWHEKYQWAVIFVVIMAQFTGFRWGRMDTLRIAILIVLFFWLIQTFVEKERKIQMSPLLFLILGLFFLSVLAFVNRPPLTGYFAIGEKFILFFLIVDFIRKRNFIRTLAELIIWTGVFSAVVAITQFILFVFNGQVLFFYAPEWSPYSVLKPTFLGDMLRATAFYPNPAGLNDYLLFALPVALFALFSPKRVKLKVFYLVAVILMAMAIFFTWSAMALIGLCAMAILFFYIHRPSLSIQYSCLLVLGGIFIYQTNLWDLVVGIKGLGEGEWGSDRIELLRLGMASLQRNPIVGLGIQNFGSFSGNFFPVGPFIFNYPVHNAFVQLATELGIFGGLLFLGIVVFLTIRLVMVLRLTLPVEERWIYKGFLLGWIGILFHMMTEPMGYGGTLWLIIGLIEGAAIVRLGGEKTHGRVQRCNKG